MTGETSGEIRAIPAEVEALRGRFIDAVGKVTREILDEGRSLDKVEELAMTLASYADREAVDWRARPESPKNVACRSGCSFCCHSEIATTIPEVILIAGTLLDESSPEALAMLREKIELHHRARLGRVGERRNHVGHPCPLLEGGTCSIYEFRPLTCRGWLSLDVSECESFYIDPSRPAKIPTDGIQRAIHQGIAVGMQAGLRSKGLEYRAVELVAGLRIALDDPSAVDRWLAGEPAFEEAELAAVAPEIHQIEETLLASTPLTDRMNP